MIQKIKIASLDPPAQRVETGAVQFTYESGEVDWGGTFIRGDHCIALSIAIRGLEEYFKKNPVPDVIFNMMELSGLRKLICEDVIVKPKV
jgi:hypothetical protein